MGTEEDTFRILMRPSIREMERLVIAEAQKNRDAGIKFIPGDWWNDSTLETFLSKYGWTSIDYFNSL